MAVMKLEATKTFSYDIDIDKIIKDYSVDRFTKYYELKKIATRVLRGDMSLCNDGAESLENQLISQLAIRLKAMKDAPITVKELQYAIDNKKFIDFGRESYEVNRTEITDMSVIDDHVIISTKFILTKVDQKTVEEIEKECAKTRSIFGTPVDYSVPYAYLASIEEVEVPSNIAQADNCSQADDHCSKSAQTPSKKETSKRVKRTKATNLDTHTIPEETDDYDPFAGVLCQKD